MALNTAHVDSVRNGVTLYTGERILKKEDKVDLTFDISPKHDSFKGTKTGYVYLTNQRLIFINNDTSKEHMRSFSMPFYYMKNVNIKQPIFGANAIAGVIKSQPGGGWESHKEAEFKLTFTTGGAIELGQLLLRVATAAPNVRPPNPGEPPKLPQPNVAVQFTTGYPPPIPGAQYPQGMPGAQYPPPPMQGAPVGGYGYPGQTVYPAYPPGGQPSEAPPTYSMATSEPSAPPPGPAYYDPNNPQNVYMTQAEPSTIPTAPPPAYSEKSKTD